MESLKDRLESHFNLFHAGLIEEAINNDNICKEDLVNAILKIHKAEGEDDGDEYVPEEFKRSVRIKFSADVVISGTDLGQIKHKWECLPLLSKKAIESNADFGEILFVEDADTLEDLTDEWNEC